jgi:putative ABC transport system permease protein
MPTMTLRSTITITITSAWAVLRMDRGTAVLLGATTALGLAAVLPVAGLMGAPDRGSETRLEVSTVQGDLLGLPWRDPRTPAGTQRQATTVLFGLLVGMAAATLGTGCITLVALVGARDAVRSSDDGVRRAVGASRKVIRRAALVEASVIAAIAAGIGCVLGARLGGSAATEWPGETMPYHPGVPVALVLATGAVVVLTALLPLIFARQNRLTEPDRAPRQIFGPAVAQFAASLSVLVTAALLGRYASSVASTGSIGSDAKLLQLTSASRQAATLGPRYETLIERLNAASLTVSLTSPGALAGLGTIAAVTTDCGMCSQGGIPSRFHVFYATHHLVSPDSFQALGIHLVAGRKLRTDDRAGAARVAVVNRALALRHFQRGEAVGRMMLVGDDKEWYTVVGIVDDAPAWGFGSRFQPPFTVYLSILQHPPAAAELLVGSAAPGSWPSVRQVAEALFTPPDGRIGETSLARLHAREVAPVAWFARWIAVEGWATMLIACVGMMAVMRIWVRSLLPELGLRRALGATKASVLLLVLRQAVGVVAVGVAAGCWFGWSVWNVLPTILRGAATWDTSSLAMAALPLALSTLVGAILPAVSALRDAPGHLIASAG